MGERIKLPSCRITTNTKGYRSTFTGDITYLITNDDVTDFTLNVLKRCSVPFILTISGREIACDGRLGPIKVEKQSNPPQMGPTSHDYCKNCSTKFSSPDKYSRSGGVSRVRKVSGRENNAAISPDHYQFKGVEMCIYR